jgi:hypothetical protein
LPTSRTFDELLLEIIEVDGTPHPAGPFILGVDQIDVRDSSGNTPSLAPVLIAGDLLVVAWPLPKVAAPPDID